MFCSKIILTFAKETKAYSQRVLSNQNKMETKKVKSVSLSEEQVAEMKQRIIERGMRKYILFNVATKKKIYEVSDAPARLKTSRLHTAGFRIHPNPIL